MHDGCVFAVSTEPPSFAKVCNGELLEEVPLDGAGPELRLRLVNGWVWINDIETGGAWLTNAEAELSRIDDWGAALADQQLDESDATVEDGGGIEEVRLNPDSARAELIDADQKDDDDENEPPVARDDESQTRIDRSSARQRRRCRRRRAAGERCRNHRCIERPSLGNYAP